jgi:UMF1 family MFS transporter
MLKRTLVSKNDWLRPGVSRGQFWAWASLDFANSGYTTVVLTSVFNAYFVATVMSGQPSATMVWTLILALSYGMVMVSAPVLGAYADRVQAKRRLLWISTIGCVISTALLAWVGPGMWLLAAVLLIISNLCYATNQDLVAAFLPDLAQPDHLARASGYGWAWGYFGGLAALALSLVWVNYAGDAAPQRVVGGAMVITAVLFAIAAFPSLWVLRETQPGDQEPAHAPSAVRSSRVESVWDASWGKLLASWRASRDQPDLKRFLGCVLVYHAGVQTVITLAAVYAQEAMGFSMAQTILLILVVNLTAAAGAWVFGHFQDRLGHRRGLAISLLAWMAMVVLAWMATSEMLFWLAAHFAGLAMGASQSGARAAVAYMARPGREAETFGLWGVAVNGSAILGPLAYGLTTWLTQGDHRTAMLVTGLFFLAGLALLFRVDFERGHRAAGS